MLPSMSPRIAGGDDGPGYHAKNLKADRNGVAGDGAGTAKTTGVQMYEMAYVTLACISFRKTTW